MPLRHKIHQRGKSMNLPSPKIVWCRCVASAAIQLRKLGVRSTKSPAGAVLSAQCENLIHQVRELRRNLLRSCAVPVGSRNFVPRPLAVEPPTGGKNMRATRPHTPRQVRVTCTTANKVAVVIKIGWCRCSASAAIQLRKLGVRCTKSPAGAVQSAQWRELDSSSSRATAKSPVVMRCARRLSELRSSSVSGGTADGGKEHEGSAPSYSAAGENHLHLGKLSLPS